MNDFVVVQVLHADGDLFRPRDDPRGSDDLRSFLDDLVEWTVRTEFHDDCEYWRESANTPGKVQR